MSQTASPSLTAGREAYEARAWQEAAGLLLSADRDEPLNAEDLERLGTAAYLSGQDSSAIEAWSRAFKLGGETGEHHCAARCGFWCGFALIQRGDFSLGSGWIDRTQRLLDERCGDCPEQGYLRYLNGLRAVFQGDAGSAHAFFSQGAKIGERYRHPDVIAFSRIGQGRCLIYLGEPAEAVSLFDESMIAVVARELSPIAAGNSYCTVIEGCQEIFDLRRAQEWTRALSDWCDAQPEMVVYRAACLIHRAEVMHLHGDWDDARAELDLAFAELAQRPAPRPLGAAHYLQAEIERLLGNRAAAEDAYGEANRWGREPQPGLALLRLAEGKPDVAMRGLRRHLQESIGPSRSRSLEPFVEVSLASGAADSARPAADELEALAVELHSQFLEALGRYAEGSLLLAGDDPGGAIVELRRAWRLWHEQEVPYELARTRTRLSDALAALGDEDGARMELEAARQLFETLGALPDLARIQKVSEAAGFGLTRRELEVLRLIASGRSNRGIASALVISERTVGTHVGHILSKLGLPSRSAATSFAHEHGLLSDR